MLSAMFGHRGYEPSMLQSVARSQAQHEQNKRERPSSAPPMAANFHEWQEGHSNDALLPAPPGVKVVDASESQSIEQLS